MKLVSLLILGLVLISSCSKDQTEPRIEQSQTHCDSIPKSFSTDVFPIFSANCVGCHNSSSPSGGYSLENYSEITQNLTICLKTIKHEAGNVPMPYQSNPLSDSLIEIIECWQADGAPNN